MAKVSYNLLKHGLIPFLEKRKADAHTIHQLLHIREIAEEEVFLRTTLWYQDFCFEHCTAFEMKISDKLKALNTHLRSTSDGSAVFQRTDQMAASLG